MAGNPDEKVPEVKDETSRLAILDLDWSKVIDMPSMFACLNLLNTAAGAAVHLLHWAMLSPIESFFIFM